MLCKPGCDTTPSASVSSMQGQHGCLRITREEKTNTKVTVFAEHMSWLTSPPSSLDFPSTLMTDISAVCTTTSRLIRTNKTIVLENVNSNDFPLTRRKARPRLGFQPRIHLDRWAQRSLSTSFTFWLDHTSDPSGVAYHHISTRSEPYKRNLWGWGEARRGSWESA